MSSSSEQNRLKITSVERIDGIGIVVRFSDHTKATFTVEQLANMGINHRQTPEELLSELNLNRHVPRNT